VQRVEGFCGVSASVAQEAEEHRINQKRPELLRGKIATVYLDLKTVDTTNISAGVGAPGSTTTPGSTKPTPGSTKTPSQASVVPFKGFGGWLPSLTISDATTWTVDSQINLPYELDGFNTNACKSVKLDQQPDRYGFSKWLRDTLAAISRVANIEGAKDRTLTV